MLYILQLKLSYCILFWYLEGRINYVNDEWGIYNSDDDIYKKKTEKDYKLIERINETIQMVYELKPNIFSRYKITCIKNIIEEDKEKQHDYEMRYIYKFLYFFRKNNCLTKIYYLINCNNLLEKNLNNLKK